MLNITTFLDVNAKRLDKPVFLCPERNTQYNSREILSISSEIARNLKKYHVEKGDRVMIYLNSSPEYLYSYFAIWRIGAVAIPTNRVYTSSELHYFAKNSEAKVIITDNEGYETTKSLSIPTYIPESIETFRDAEIIPPEPTEFDDICQLQYTSGTTGKPKGAILTHGNWLAAIHNESEVLALQQNDIYLGIYPMGHVGLSWGISALHSGALYIMMERYNPQKYLTLCKEFSVSVLAGMPPVIHSLTEAPSGTETYLKSVREIISGGSPLHHTIWKKFHSRYHIPIINSYGLSETIVIGTGTAIRPDEYIFADKFLSVGYPTSFSEVKIVNETDASKEISRGMTGEIALRGPAVSRGYWNMPDETRETFLPDGWFLTGDIGYLDTDGRLYITDRKKDMIVMSGWKIYPTEVENVLIKFDKVQDLAVFGLPHEHRGEIPAVAVVWKQGYSEKNTEELLAFAAKHLAPYKIPRKVISTESLPRINGWKLLRRQLKEEYS